MNKPMATAMFMIIEAGIDLLAGELRKRERRMSILMD